MLRTIIAIAQEAGEILKKYHRADAQTLGVRFKTSEFDPVTNADLEADRHIRARLAAAFPQDHILSEEHEATVDWRGRVWVIDPLDGTKYFVKGTEWYTVHIGLCEEGIPILGVVAAPAFGTVYAAERGKGAFLYRHDEVHPLRVSTTASLEHARAIVRLNIGDKRPFEPAVAQILAQHRITRALPAGAGLKLCLIASGDADLYINPSLDVHTWDTCAPQVVLEEAGGRLTDFLGSPLDYRTPSGTWDRSFVASNGRVHERLLQETRRIPFAREKER